MSDVRPGDWMELSRAQYERLVRLARRRLIGHEHHAEDVVSRALVRWLAIPADTSRARIETVIISEAYSLLRSEARRRAREQRVADDRSSPGRATMADPADDLSAALLRRHLAAACRRARMTPSTTDLEVLELLLAGLSLAETARVLKLPRHRVKAARLRWQAVLRDTDL